MVSEIEVVPSQISVTGDATDPTTFVLEARLWTGVPGDRSGILESAGVKVAWSVSPSSAGVDLVGSPAGYRATVRVQPGTNPTTVVTVTASAGGIGAASQVIPPGGSAEDQIETAYTADQIPDAAIVRGLRTTADNPCAVWLTAGLVRTGTSGQATDGCTGDNPGGGVAVLDPAHAMETYPATWSSTGDKVTALSPGTFRSMPIALRVFVGSGTDLATRQAKAVTFAKVDIEDANQVFQDSRLGIQLNVVDIQTVTPPGPPGTETSIRDCAAGDDLTKSHDYLSAVPVLHIYMVDDPGGADGFTCPGTEQRPQTVIYVREVGISGTFMLHELGHALGMNLPGAGHSDDLAGFDPANVMASGYADTDDVWRRRLTVGQVLRMNADSASWLNWAKKLDGTLLREDDELRVGCQCEADDLPGKCPRVVDDVAHPRGGKKTTRPLYCHDVITLGAGIADDPRALIAGRRWRTPPGECPSDLRGTFWSNDGVDYIRLNNLTRAGGCASWLAIFFKNHEPIFRDLKLVPERWTDAADELLLASTTDPPAPVTLGVRIAVKVHVHFNPVDETDALAGITEAESVYGPDNRTGLALIIFPVKGAFTTCPAAPIGEFSVCYGAPGKTVVRLIGEALGLPPLTPTQQSQAAFAANAMQPAGAGGKLTLGQVFWIHSSLKTHSFPDCTSAGADCPSLEADGAP